MKIMCCFEMGTHMQARISDYKAAHKPHSIPGVVEEAKR